MGCYVRFSEEVQEEEGDGLSILSGISDSTSGSALSSSDSIDGSSNENIMERSKPDQGSLNEAELLSCKGNPSKTKSRNPSKTKPRKYKQSKDASTK